MSKKSDPYSGGMIQIVIILVLILVGGILILYKNNKLQSYFGTNNISVAQPSKVQCKDYGWNNGEDVLPNYTVKKGDTLLSISKKILGDPSRVQELINLNKGKYPISLKDSFIEQGWNSIDVSGEELGELAVG